MVTALVLAAQLQSTTGYGEGTMRRASAQLAIRVDLPASTAKHR
jgi:hypothetical protein